MVSDGNSVTVFGDLSKPATVLIEKIGSAIGILYEPKRITRKAHAEAEARKIGALAELALASDLERRAMTRLLHQEARKQQNIEDITAEAIGSLSDLARPQDLDDDWIAHFFNACETVSDKEMQTLWSKLLAGEATVPGTFSKRTINCVSALSKNDAELFTTFCGYCWNLGVLTPLVFDETDPIYAHRGVTFTRLKHLEAIGLITFEDGLSKPELGPRVRLSYFSRLIRIDLTAAHRKNFPIGCALLTLVGHELASVCGAKANDEFFHWTLSRWIDQGSTLSSAFPREDGLLSGGLTPG